MCLKSIKKPNSIKLKKHFLDTYIIKEFASTAGNFLSGKREGMGERYRRVGVWVSWQAYLRLG
jgi:hypothetical protein